MQRPAKDRHIDTEVISYKLTRAAHSKKEVQPHYDLYKVVRKRPSLSSSLHRLCHHFGSIHLSKAKRKPAPTPDSFFVTGSNGLTGDSIQPTQHKGWLAASTGSFTSISSPTQSLASCSLASSASSFVFPLDPDFELELDIALEMAPHELGSAWSHESYNAMQYLRARTPYPPTMTDTVFDYHEQGDKLAAQPQSADSSSDRWQSALEIGCGPGQMSIHLATRFAKVYGQDPSPNMLKLANTVKLMSPEELAEVRLPPVQDPDRIQYSSARGEDPQLPPGEKVDLIMMAACIHWMDWETHESTIANWTKWASLLKPGGSLVITGGRPVIGPYTGPRGDQIRPLRDWLLDFPSGHTEIEAYYGDMKVDGVRGVIDTFRTGGLYRQMPMPWQHSPDLEQLWDRGSFSWIPIDDCTVLGEKATSAALARVDDRESFEAPLKNLPDWVRPNVRRAVWCDNSQNDLVISITTPRKMADWVRSTSGYLKYLQNNAEQKRLSLQDEDYAAVEIKKVCDQTGLGFDEEIECHHSGAVLCIRRSDKEC